MSSMTAPVRRSGGDLDVYTGLLFAAFIVFIASISSLRLVCLVIARCREAPLALQASSRASMPGSTLPSSSSSDAPPPVETKVTCREGRAECEWAKGERMEGATPRPPSPSEPPAV